MPILDHHRPPIQKLLPWRTLHSGWLSTMAIRLNRTLPPGFVALENRPFAGRFEIDVGTYEEDDRDPSPPTNGTAGGVAVAPTLWTPSPATASFPAMFDETYEVRVYDPDANGNLVAAIELISPANKDSPKNREAFAAKCAAYLGAGACLVILDAVTTRRANLHNDLVRLLDGPPESLLPANPPLYAAAYRPVIRDEKPSIDVWTAGFAVGDTLPTMPLRLTGDTFVPVEFEDTYATTCRDRRLTA